jgi:hypothetical protein
MKSILGLVLVGGLFLASGRTAQAQTVVYPGTYAPAYGYRTYGYGVRYGAGYAGYYPRRYVGAYGYGGPGYRYGYRNSRYRYGYAPYRYRGRGRRRW